MATDLERAKFFFDSLGVTYKETDETRSRPGSESFPVKRLEILTKTPKVEGYTGFTTDFVFKVDGSFITIGIWD